MWAKLKFMMIKSTLVGGCKAKRLVGNTGRLAVANVSIQAVLQELIEQLSEWHIKMLQTF